MEIKIMLPIVFFDGLSRSGFAQTPLAQTAIDVNGEGQNQEQLASRRIGR